MFPELAPERPMGPILPSVFTGTNADLIAAVAPIYLTGSVLDVTYGAGNWWTRFKPEVFTAHDLYKLDGVDFRALPEPDASVDTVCYDPPYAIGGNATAPWTAFQAAYGIGHDRLAAGTAATNRVDRIEELVIGGLLECLRVARTYVLVKCMESAQGHAADSRHSRAKVSLFHDLPHVVKCAAIGQGWETYDVIVHHTGTGPGGHNIVVPKRARRNHSYLIVFTNVPL